MSSQDSPHKTVMIGGGSAGISVAARLISAGELDVAVIDPAEVRYRSRRSPLVGTKKERCDMWLLKRYGPRSCTRNLMLKGRA